MFEVFDTNLALIFSQVLQQFFWLQDFFNVSLPPFSDRVDFFNICIRVWKQLLAPEISKILKNTNLNKL